MEVRAASQDFWMQDKGMYGILITLNRKQSGKSTAQDYTKHNRRRFPMKIKVSNYIAGKLVEAGINQVSLRFTGAVHLNDGRAIRKDCAACISIMSRPAPLRQRHARILQQDRSTVRDDRPWRHQCHHRSGRRCWIPSRCSILSGQVRYDTTVRSGPAWASARWETRGIRYCQID